MDESKIKSLDLLFKPRNIAIMNASTKVGYFIHGLETQGFNKENLYLVSDTVQEVYDIKCYKSIEEVPNDTIDLVILAVRRDKLVQTIKEVLQHKKVNFFHIFTAGTIETDEAGVKIEKEVKEMLTNTSNNTRAIGPNCMGVYCPKGKNAYLGIFPPESGNIGLIFHSGDLHTKMIRYGAARYGLKFSKGVSVGNCLDLQVSEFLEYFNQDEDTDIICVYFEGFSQLHPHEGKKLFEVLKKMEKPALLMKGGQTQRAQKAVVSHTGSLATQQKIWDAIYQQTPTVEINPSLDEMVDIANIFYRCYKERNANVEGYDEFKCPKGKNALVILWSGGIGILATDTLTQMGIDMPLFEGETKERLMKVYPLKIGSLSNPLDLPWIGRTDIFYNLSTTAITEDIDVVFIETDAPREFKDDWFTGYYENLKRIRDYINSLNKILILILHEYPEANREKYYEMLIEDEFIIYPTIERAANAYLALYDYGQKRKLCY